MDKRKPINVPSEINLNNLINILISPPFSVSLNLSFNFNSILIRMNLS